MKGVNDKPGTPNYDLKRLALKSTSLRLYPNYVNCDFSNQVIADTDDIKVRQQILDSLSEEEQEKLIIAIKEHPELSESLGVELED